MKAPSFYRLRFVAAIAVGIVMAGCAITIETADVQQLQTGSPLKSVDPKRFILREFNDARGVAPLLVGNIRFREINLDKTAATVAAAAIKKEFERNGHACIADTPESKADFVIEGTVYKYWLREDTSFFMMKIIGNVAVKMTVSSIADDKKVLTKNYEGEYYLTTGAIGFITPSEWIAISNQSLLAMVKEISTDPELIAVIRK